MAQKKHDGRKQRQRNRKGRGSAFAPTGLSTRLVGFADRFRIVHMYTNTVSLSPAAGVASYQSYRGNSVYDPDFSGVGTTAFAYSQASAVYNRYRVLASRIEVLASCTSGTLQIFLQASINNAPPVATLYTVGQRHVAMGGVSVGGPSVWKHTAVARTAQVFGVPQKQVLSEDDFAGIVGGNPNNVWYYHVVAYNPTAAGATLTLTVRVEYETVWSMPTNLAP